MTTREQTRALMARVVLGELDAQAPALQAALAEHPDLARELDSRRTAPAGGQRLLGDTAAVAAEAKPTAADRERVRRALEDGQRARRRKWRPWLVAAAALLVAAGASPWWWPRPAPDGPLGTKEPLRIERLQDGTFRAHLQDALPPGASYRLQLIVDGVPRAEATTTAPLFPFPPEWQRILAGTSAATLRVEIPELALSRQAPVR